VYCLYLSTHYWIHNVFHVSYLKPYNWHLDDDNADVTLFRTDQQKEEYKIEEILRKQRRKGELWYKVKWIDYSQSMISESLNKILMMHQSYMKCMSGKEKTSKMKHHKDEGELYSAHIEQLHLKVH
jgi:hypothetical protein